MAGKLKPIYTVVARELALGISLEDICVVRSLNLETMRRVVRGDLFKEELRRFQDEVDREILEQVHTDPVLQKLKTLSYNAVGRLESEMDNFDPETGGTGASRISASKAILDRSGYTGKQEDKGDTKVIIMLSESKLDAVKKAVDVKEEILANVPDSVDGHLK